MKTEMAMEWLRGKDVLKYLKITHNTLYRWIHDRGFPPPKKPSPNISLWSKKEIDDWINSKAEI